MAMDSLFKFNPKGCLMILSKSMDSECGYRILKPLLGRGFKVKALTPDLPFLVKNTPDSCRPILSVFGLKNLTSLQASTFERYSSLRRADGLRDKRGRLTPRNGRKNGYGQPEQTPWRAFEVAEYVRRRRKTQRVWGSNPALLILIPF
ncbi:hypothetical protein CerSpe_130000 [Prunus speciosa]